MATNDGNRTNLASSKIQTSRSLSYWFERIRAFLRSFLCSGATRRSRFASRSNRLSRLVNPRTSNSDMAAC